MKTKDDKMCVITKHLHSGCSTWQSRDEHVYLETSKDKLDFTLAPGILITKSKSLPILVLDTIEEITETLDILKLHMLSDKTFYNRTQSRGEMGIGDSATKEEMAKLLSTYTNKGWLTQIPLLEKTLRDQSEKITEMFRKSEGFVFPAWDKNRDTIEFQGGLSNKLFKNAVIQDYLKRGGAHGFIGHSSRTFASDRTTERTLIELGHSNFEIAHFMCGSTGRHFADQLGSYYESENQEQIAKHLPNNMEHAMEWIKQEVTAHKILKAGLKQNENIA